SRPQQVLVIERLGSRRGAVEYLEPAQACQPAQERAPGDCLMGNVHAVNALRERRTALRRSEHGIERREPRCAGRLVIRGILRARSPSASTLFATGPFGDSETRPGPPPGPRDRFVVGAQGHPPAHDAPSMNSIASSSPDKSSPALTEVVF